MARKITYESRIEQAKQRIAEKPREALREVGKILVSEIRKSAPISNIKARWVTRRDGKKVVLKPGRLKKGISYWLRRREGDLQVGAKSFYAPYMEFGTSRIRKTPFLLPAVMNNVKVIQELVTQALKELSKK